jgi:uncharacterized membrane protein
VRRSDERGAIAVMAVLLLTVVLTFTAFAVDLGTQRVARRDMQSLADAAAMDLARQLKGRSAATILADPSFTRVKNQAIQQNDLTVGSAPALTTALGTVNTTTGVFTPVSGSAVPTAVKVIAATSVGFAFAPGEGQAARSAVATSSDPLVCFSVSPSALMVDTSGSLLGPLLDSILKVKLNVLNPAGLLEVRGLQVPLADIAVELSAGTPQALLNLSNVSLQSFVLASATALSKNGYTAQAAALKAIGLQISGAYVDVGKILSLETANAAGLASSVNVFDLVSAAIFASNGTNAINVKNLSLVVPGLGGVQELSATITEPPQIACGKAGVTAKGAQVKLRLRSKVDPLGVGAADVQLALDLELGRSEGTLKSIVCGSLSSAVITTKTGAALGTGSLEVAVLRNLGILFGSTALLVKTKLTASAGAGGPTDLTFTAPTDGSTMASRSVSGTSVLGLAVSEPSIGLLDGSLVGAILGAIINPLLGGIVTGVVNPLVAAGGPVDALLSAILYPVLKLLGITIAQTDVTVHGRLDCQTVKLVG